ncbi:MAG: arsenosugar biosynthesis radical SAM protein ArsS [Myxococcales bacterium]|nr:arsenosugar biosynthesis radical SAM protein ArsS [Myxococcales bacterium]
MPPRLTDRAASEPSAVPWTEAVRRGGLRTLQLNLGRLCNLACLHCHVEAGPQRREKIAPEVLGRVSAWIVRHRPPVVDLTGGAPELISGFRELVTVARRAGCSVLDRCNLAVLDEPGQEDLHTFLAAHEVGVVASLPCYLRENVDAQRGRGTYDRSIAGLRKLNGVGYGRQPELPLHLVYNPLGASLPPPQPLLEGDYRTRLWDDWSIEFTSLWCLANVPIRRFRRYLQVRGELGDYEAKLAAAYNPETLVGLMCRSTLSVDHEGRLYDCDFNLALGVPLGGARPGPHLWDISPTDLTNRPVAMASAGPRARSRPP